LEDITENRTLLLYYSHCFTFDCVTEFAPTHSPSLSSLATMSDQLPSKKSKAEEKRHTTMLYFQLADALVGDKRFSAIIGKMGLRPDPHSKAIRNADSLILQHATAVGLDVSVGDQTPFNYVKKRVNAFKLGTLSDNADGVRRLSELFAKGRAFKKQSNSLRI
jgi:hypothetical protein